MLLTPLNGRWKNTLFKFFEMVAFFSMAVFAITMLAVATVIKAGICEDMGYGWPSSSCMWKIVGGAVLLVVMIVVMVTSSSTNRAVPRVIPDTYEEEDPVIRDIVARYKELKKNNPTMDEQGLLKQLAEACIVAWGVRQHTIESLMRTGDPKAAIQQKQFQSLPDVVFFLLALWAISTGKRQARDLTIQTPYMEVLGNHIKQREKREQLIDKFLVE